MQTANAAIGRHILPSIILLLSSGYAAGQENSSLDKEVSFSGTHITLGKALSSVEEQTDFVFIFDAGVVNTGMSVRLSGNRMRLKEALQELFQSSGLQYVVHSRFIAINPTSTTLPAVSSVTNDAYLPSDPSTRSAAPLKRPDSLVYAPESYEIERIVTLVSAERVERSYPVSYSDYTPVNAYLNRALPRLAVKTNLLYGAALLTPNLSVELAVGRHRTFELSVSYQAWGRGNTPSEMHKQLAHWMLRPEYRWWGCERFDGAYWGIHALYSRYYVSGRTLPLLFDKKYSYDGHAAGAGLTFGYQWPFAKRWSLDLNVGLGYAYLWFDKGACSVCDPQPVSADKHYFGPTRAGINLVFILR